jgi:endonuclease/exonuclease/phosphatase family metal-dependent hydrolase
MKLVTYNIHYGIGKDGRADLARIAAALRGADVIALQEVDRNYAPRDEAADQPARLEALLPEYHWVYGPAFDVDDSETRPDGTVVNRRRQHGVMLLSRTPIPSCRPLGLPKIPFEHDFNMRMGALEGVIDSPLGSLRVYAVHFGHLDSGERQLQAAHLLAVVRAAPGEGGAWSGPNNHLDRDWAAGKAVPPMPKPAVLLGDFNMVPDSPEYAIMTAQTADDHGSFTDAWPAAGNAAGAGLSWHELPGRPARPSRRIDYCFVGAPWANRVSACWVDGDAPGSDHQPVWTELSA